MPLFVKLQKQLSVVQLIVGCKHDYCLLGISKRSKETTRGFDDHILCINVLFLWQHVAIERTNCAGSVDAEQMEADKLTCD